MRSELLCVSGSMYVPSTPCVVLGGERHLHLHFWSVVDLHQKHHMLVGGEGKVFGVLRPLAPRTANDIQSKRCQNMTVNGFEFSVNGLLHGPIEVQSSLTEAWKANLFCFL